MKQKLLAMFLAVSLLFTACGTSTPDHSDGAAPSESQASVVSQDNPQPESAASPSASKDSESVEASQVSADNDTPEGTIETSIPQTEAIGDLLSVAAPKGPTSMGMAQLMNENSEGGIYHFTLVGSPDELVGGMVQGEYDIAAMPLNLAANLYQKTGGKVQLAAINTLGVLYIVESGDTVHSVEDLRGKTIYATGQGSTPEYALNYVLTSNGLTPGADVQVEYKTEHAELASLLAAGKADLALLPQPFVTTASMQNPDLRIALDLTEEWEKVSSDEGQLVMGCLAVQSSLVEENPEALDAFLTAYRNSVNFVKAEENRSIAAQMMERMDIIKADIAEQALPQCGLTFLRGAKMRESAEGFLKVLFQSDPKSVGGELPEADFYYGAE